MATKSIWSILDAILQPAVDAYGRLRGVEPVDGKCPEGYQMVAGKCQLIKCPTGYEMTANGCALVGSGGGGIGATAPCPSGYKQKANGACVKKSSTTLIIGGVLIVGTITFFAIKKLKKS